MTPHLQPRPRPAEPLVLHLEHCDCPVCTPPAERRALSLGEAARWGLAGCLCGNVVAFLADPHGTWAALASAGAQLVGR